MDTTIFNAIHKMLLQDWDPIGVGDIPEAEDEYDSYISKMYSIVKNSSSHECLFDYLWYLETEHMGLRGNLSKTKKFSKNLFNKIKKLQN